MISVHLVNTSLILGSQPIFRDLTWEIQHEQKIGLIGANGSGKSSLLKLITGEYTPEPGGVVVRARSVTVGYLPQHPELDPNLTALSAALEGNPRIREIENELERVETSLNDPAVYGDSKALSRALAAQQSLLEEYSGLGGESYPGRVRELLLGLGLPEIDLEKPLSFLSGGQKKLVGLTRVLLQQPSVLLLDEPDNHLDLAGKSYLEQLIRDYPGAVVIVSHDRYLLDAVVTHIAEVEARPEGMSGKMASFRGDYTSFMLDKEERLARQEELYQIQKRSRARMQAAVKRYAEWVKVSDKFASRLKAMRTQLERFDETKTDRPILEQRRIGLELNGWRGSSKVLELRGVNKSFGERLIFNHSEQTIWHGERVGLIGPNGSGKSVLFRLLLGLEHLDAGEIYIGPSVKIGYYAQEHETLDFNTTPLETVRRTGNLSEPSAVSFLMRYLFTYPQCTSKISQLSGGERSRLQLALLVLSGANFLLLDEPTNNLDIASAEVLEAALDDFVGTVLVISHDRYFLDRVVDRLLMIQAGQLIEFTGSYGDALGLHLG